MKKDASRRMIRRCEGWPEYHAGVEGHGPKKLGSNLGPNTAKLGPKPCTMTQNKARRTNKIDFLQLPWAQEVPSSNLGAPTNSFIYRHLATLALGVISVWISFRQAVGFCTNC